MNEANHHTFDREVLKQRIVGAAVLIILLALLWPLFFNFDDMLDMELELKTPPAPNVEKIEIATAKPKPSTAPELKEPQAKQAIANPTQVKTEANSVKKNAAEPVAKPKPAAKQVPVVTSPASRQSDKSESESTTPRLDKRGIPISYVVQLGSFNVWANAEKLRDNLIAKGYKAYISPVASTYSPPYQVFAGPFLTTADASKADKAIKQHFKLNDTLIRRFSPPSI